MKRILPALLFFFLSAVYFGDVLFQDKVLIPTNPADFQPWSKHSSGGLSNTLMADSLLLTYPWRTYNHSFLARGELPFWNPYIFCGLPHLAIIQSNSLYPLTLAFDLLDPVRGIGYAMALHLALAGLMMFAFLRRIELPVSAAVVGAVIFQFNGMFLVRMSAPSYVFSGIWIPLLLIGVEDLFKTGSIKKCWTIVLGIFLSVVGGHPQIFVLSFLLAFSYLVLRCGVRRRSLLLFFGSTAAGLGLAAYQLLPFAEFLISSYRGPVPREMYHSAALPLVGLLQALVPDLFGHPVDNTYWLNQWSSLIQPKRSVQDYWILNYCGENLFTGIAPLVLAGYAVVKRRCLLTFFFAMFVLVSLAVLLGTPLLDLAYYVLPTFQYSRPDRIIYLYMVSVSILAALGFAQIVRNEEPAEQKSAYWWIPGTLFLILILMLAWPFLTDSHLRAAYAEWMNHASREINKNWPLLRNQFAMSATVGVASLLLIAIPKRKTEIVSFTYPIWILLLVVPLFRFGWHFNPSQSTTLFPKTEEETLLSGRKHLFRIAHFGGLNFPPNLPQTFGIFDVNGASAAALQNFAEIITHLDPNAISRGKYFFAITDPKFSDSRLLDLLNVQFVLSDAELLLPFVHQQGKTLRIYQNPDVLPRFFLVNRVETYIQRQEGMRRLVSSEFDPGKTALLPRESIPNFSDTAPSPSQKIKVLEYASHEIVLEVEAASESILVSSEVFYPGWKTYLNGKKVETLLVNMAFRGARIPGGKHKVVFRYRPVAFYGGASLSALTLAVIFLFARFRRDHSQVVQEDLLVRSE